jgi:hypothetical protein
VRGFRIELLPPDAGKPAAAGSPTSAYSGSPRLKPRRNCRCVSGIPTMIVVIDASRGGCRGLQCRFVIKSVRT